MDLNISYSARISFTRNFVDSCSLSNRNVPILVEKEENQISILRFWYDANSIKEAFILLKFKVNLNFAIMRSLDTVCSLKWCKEKFDIHLIKLCCQVISPKVRSWEVEGSLWITYLNYWRSETIHSCHGSITTRVFAAAVFEKMYALYK